MPTSSKYTLTVPIDASGVDDAKGRLKVAVLDAKGAIVQTKRVELDAKKQASATFTLEQPVPGGRVVVAPDHIDDETLPRLQTIREVLPSRPFARSRELKLQPIVISPYYWHLWWILCREFTITGKIICPDGRPAPGARICVYDVDWFWFWQSKQLIGCTYADANGAFQLKFKWCCNLWPWWWWWEREWLLDLELAEKVISSLPPELKVKPLPPIGPKPDLAFFDAILPSSNLDKSSLDAAANNETSISRFITNTERLRPELAKIVPQIPGPWWPWYPWQPWYDCNPDVVFTATQECEGKEVTILNEGFWSVRPDIPTQYNVVLHANSNACCRPDHHVCGDEDCLILTSACNVERNDIGQDTTPANIAFAGLVNPALGATLGRGADRPFAGSIVVDGTPECMGSDAEYYEVEYSYYNGSSWSAYAPVPVGSLGGFVRTYLEFPGGMNPPIWHHETFAPHPVGGKNVYTSRNFFESTHPWLCNGVNCDVMFVWLTDSATWADGLYKLRVRPYKLVGAVLQDVPLNSCGENHPSELALRLDNRPIPDPLHLPTGHPCGTNSVHLCSVQPDVDIQQVRLVHADDSFDLVDACGQYTIADGDSLEIDILVYDVDQHLGIYTLIDTFGESEYRDLLAGLSAGSGLTNAGADAVGPEYKDALSQGAIAPNWQGGVITVTIDADKMCDKFPVTCCYQLELRAWKRTIVDCNQLHGNLAEYSFFLARDKKC